MWSQYIASALLPAVLLSSTAFVSSAWAHGKNHQDSPQGTEIDEKTLKKIRRATERFKDINVAIREGYITPQPPHCVYAAEQGEPRQLGAMGVHYIHPDLIGRSTDFKKPSVLVYEPQEDGSYELVAIENLVFAEAWHGAGNTGRPQFKGNEYYYSIDNPNTPWDEAHGLPPHYELHLWLYRENPSGLLMQYNPKVKCPGVE